MINRVDFSYITLRDISSRYYTSSFFGLMVIFGHSVLAVGLNFSAVRFLFIWLSSFGLMDPPRINAFSLYVRYSDPVRSLINSLFFVQPFQCTVCDPPGASTGCRTVENTRTYTKTPNPGNVKSSSIS